MRTAITLGCQAMQTRLAAGPVSRPARIEDIEETTGLLIAHGIIEPATFRDSAVRDLDLSGATMYGIHFVGCRFLRVDFLGADLRGASFVGCEFEDCRLDDADLAGVMVHAGSFRTCSLAGVRWDGAEVTRTEVDAATTGWPSAPDGYRNRVAPAQPAEHPASGGEDRCNGILVHDPHVLCPVHDR